MVLKYKGYNRTRDKLWTITYIHTFDLNYNWGHYWGTRTEAIVGTFYFESHRQILPWFCWRKKDFDLFTSKWMLRGLNRMLRKKNSHGRNATVSLSTYDDSNGDCYFSYFLFFMSFALSIAVALSLSEFCTRTCTVTLSFDHIVGTGIFVCHLRICLDLQPFF